MTPKLESLFGGLFSPRQTVKQAEEYLRALERASREVATWDEAEVSNTSPSNQKEKGWVN